MEKARPVAGVIHFFKEDNRLKIGHLTKTMTLSVLKKKVTPLPWRYLIGKFSAKLI